MLDEISFCEYAKFVKSCPLKEATMFLKFVFDRQNIEEMDGEAPVLTNEWKSVYDHLWVQDHLVTRVLNHLDDAQDLLETLLALENRGVIAKKSEKLPTGYLLN
jgi:hypothetical protein